VEVGEAFAEPLLSVMLLLLESVVVEMVVDVEELEEVAVCCCWTFCWARRSCLRNLALLFWNQTYGVKRINLLLVVEFETNGIIEQSIYCRIEK